MLQQIERTSVHPREHRLTDRERDCYGLLAQGLRTQKIAEELGIAPITVDYHFRNARVRIGALTREQTLAIAVQQGWVKP